MVKCCVLPCGGGTDRVHIPPHSHHCLFVPLLLSFYLPSQFFYLRLTVLAPQWKVNLMLSASERKWTVRSMSFVWITLILVPWYCRAQAGHLVMVRVWILVELFVRLYRQFRIILAILVFLCRLLVGLKCIFLYFTVVVCASSWARRHKYTAVGFLSPFPFGSHFLHIFPCILQQNPSAGLLLRFSTQCGRNWTQSSLPRR